MGKPKAQIRLDQDVAHFVIESAKANSRSVPAEVNHVLRILYLQREAKKRNLKAKAGGEITEELKGLHAFNAAVREHTNAVE